MNPSIHLSSVRIITGNIQQLVQFYEQVTGSTFTWHTDDFAELRTPLATLAIGSTRTLGLFGGDAVATPANNRSVIIEFRVADVDAVYEQIGEVLISRMVQVPTTMPWGNRSLLFRDPDGNLVNFFTPMTVDARQRFETVNENI